MTKPLQPISVLIALSLFLVPLLGGQLSMDLLPLLPKDLWFLQLTGSTATPALAHMVSMIGLFVALMVLLLGRRVISVPRTLIVGLLVAFVTVLGLSVGLSNYRSISIAAILPWIWYAVIFFTCAAGIGRKGAPLMLGALVAGLTVAALMGINEYSAVRLADPNYRVFAGFNNPNAAGAAFLFGIPLAIILSISAERLPKLGCYLAAILQLFALFLTQSKGSLLVCAVSLIIMVALAFVWRSKSAPILAITTLVIGLVGGGMAFGLQNANAKLSQGSGPLARYSNSSEVSTQSAGFRKLLWKGSLEIIKSKPQGVGIGAYSFVSTQPGLTTQTKLTHNSFLQIAVEASPVALLLLLGFVGSTVWLSMRGITRHSESGKLIAVGILSALAAAVAHNMVDSDLYTFGLGAMFFALLGILVAQSTDSTAPELLPTNFRRSIATTGGVLVLLTSFVAYAEMGRATARGFLTTGDRESALRVISSVLGMFPNDGQATALRANLASNPQDAMYWAKTSAGLHPSPKSYRLIALLAMKENNPSQAAEVLRLALQLDPNNLRALKLLIDAEVASGDTGKAVTTARRLVDVEKSPYYQVRSQPELVPTETFEARLFLADQEEDAKTRQQLLWEAVKGFGTYRDITTPMVIRSLKQGASEVGGESTDTMDGKMSKALEATAKLKARYKLDGSELAGSAAELSREERAFSDRLFEIRK